VNNSHNNGSNNSQESPSNFDSDPNTFNNLIYPVNDSGNNLNLKLSQISSNNLLKENFINFPAIFYTNKEKKFHEKSNIPDPTMNLTSIPTHNITSSGNICNSPILNIVKNSSRMNSYPASSNPSNNNLTSITDFNLIKGSTLNASGSLNNQSSNSLGINISNNSNFVCANHYSHGNSNKNSNGSVENNPNNSHTTNTNNINSFLSNFYGNLNSTTAYSNYLNSYPEIYKSAEEFMENFYSLVNMLKSCITEIINNDYTIRSLTNIIKNIGNSGNMNANSNVNIGNNQGFGNFENLEITQVNYLNQEGFNKNKQNK